MNRKAGFLLISFLAAVFLVLSTSALAETVLWKWVDEKGNIHYVEYKNQVPSKYKDKAQKVVIKGKSDTATGEGGAAATPPPPPHEQKPQKSKTYTEWKEKAYSAYMRVQDLENRIADLEPKCNELRRQSLLMPTIKNQQASAECFNKLQGFKSELEKARKYLEDGIDREAMRSGVPLDAVNEGIEKAKQDLKKKK